MSLPRGPGSGRAFVPARILRPVQAFVHTEAASGVVLLGAVAIALLWANSFASDSYSDLWHAAVRFEAGPIEVDDTLGHLVNDGVMTLFFFVVALEIKRELLRGELASPRRAALPVIAALGGMVAPALIYAAFNGGGEGSSGWGVPMATDIAFALGVVALAGRAAPFSLRVFLLALAIVDDLGAIAVLTVFYSGDLAGDALAWAGVALGVLLAARWAGVRSFDMYFVLGGILWFAVYKTGVHATLAGVLLGFLTPAGPYYARSGFAAVASDLVDRFRRARETGDGDTEQELLRQMEVLARGTEAPLDRLEAGLHSWVSFGIIPVFALANAGIELSGDFVSEAASSRIAIGAAAGLLVGKPLGILMATWMGCRLGLCQLPAGLRYRDIAAAGIVAGIGFTVSLFIAVSAFDETAMQDEAKAGVFVASLLAGAAGYLALRLVGRQAGPEAPRA